MKLSVELYIKKNTLEISGASTGTNASPFFSIETNLTMTTNQYVGFYVKIINGDSAGLISWILANNTTRLTLETGIPIATGDKFEIYRSDYQRLDLFKDEKISITSQIGNANDIGKLYTDYTQSFTIPASKNNNQILSHWYESSIDNGFDHRMRYDAYIEVNTHRFKDGTIQLEKADKKDGFIENYSVTFYGKLTQLKDIIKDEKLNSLDFTSFNHEYNSTNVKTRITTDVAGVKYPLIGNQKKYYYQDPLRPSEDITTSAGAILWNELFPAIKVSDIFARIQAKYGITFTGSFFNLDQWTKLYLYLKSAEKLTFKSEPLLLNFTGLAPFSGPMPEMNFTTDTLRISNWAFDSNLTIYEVTTKVQRIYIFFRPSSQIIPYTLYAYRNGILFTTFELIGDTDWIYIDQLVGIYGTGPVHSYTFKISSNSSMTIDFGLRLEKAEPRINRITRESSMSTINTTAIGNNNTNTFIPIGNFMPDMKIVDFITGLIKAFNLMIIPKPNNVYEFIPLEMYYNAGKILDITDYTYQNEMSINKPKLFKSINFKYEESKNILNNAYRGLYLQEYGDLIYNSERITENSTYDIKLPFENVLFEVPKQGKLFQTATLIDKDLKPYTPKPMLIYCNGLVTPLTGTDRIYMTNSSGAATQITNYQRFSNEYDSLPTDVSHSHLMTMNFGNEQSSWLNQLAPQGLYFRHYKNYIDNLYNIKTRLIKVKALLPSSLLGNSVTNTYGIPLGIALNDRLIIRNKRYLINSFTTDLTTGETDFELLTDYRAVNAESTIGYRFASFQNIQTDKNALVLDVEIYLNDYEYFDVKGSVDFVSYTASANNTNDITLTVTIPANGTAIDRFSAITLEYYRNGVKENDQYIFITQTGI
jgi:hypothetical protein